MTKRIALPLVLAVMGALVSLGPQHATVGAVGPAAPATSALLYQAS